VHHCVLYRPIQCAALLRTYGEMEYAYGICTYIGNRDLGRTIFFDLLIYTFKRNTTLHSVGTLGRHIAHNVQPIAISLCVIITYVANKQ